MFINCIPFQVYIVAMQQHLAPPSNGDEYEEERPRDSLLNLVQPELGVLSLYWLAALRDHALLALPSEFASQLPSDGGAFYNPEAMETTKPHYQKAWSPIVFAAALWLNSGGFAIIERNEEGLYGGLASSGPTLPGMLGMKLPATHNKAPEELKSDYFHLIFGEWHLNFCNGNIVSFPLLSTMH